MCERLNIHKAYKLRPRLTRLSRYDRQEQDQLLREMRVNNLQAHDKRLCKTFRWN